MISEIETLDTAIIGSGIAGMTFGKTIQELGLASWKIFEKTEKGGGLSGSWESPNGFTYDTGTHVIHFQTQDFYETIMSLKVDVIRQTRVAMVYFDNQFVDFPFQKNFYQHSNKSMVDKCMVDMKEADKVKDKPVPMNFEEKCIGDYGKALIEIYMKPYNERVWSVKMNELGTHWSKSIIPPIRLDDINKKMETGDRKDTYGLHAQFMYPKYGGNGKVWEEFQKQLLPAEKVKNLHNLKEVDVENKVITFENGTKYKFKRLCSTIELPELAKKLVNFKDSEKLNSLISQLKYTQNHMIGLGYKGELPECFKGVHWAYFSDIGPFYRMTLLSNLSPFVTPEGCCSVLVEVNTTTMEGSKEVVIEACLNTLEKYFKLEKSRHVDTSYKFLDYGYPIPLVNLPTLSKEIITLLEKYDIWSFGRFGDWKYEESNQEPLYIKVTGIAKRFMGKE